MEICTFQAANSHQAVNAINVPSVAMILSVGRMCLIVSFDVAPVSFGWLIGSDCFCALA